MHVFSLSFQKKSCEISQINHLRAKRTFFFVWRASSYRAVNILHLDYNKTGSVRVKVTFRYVHKTMLPWKAASITYSDCVSVPLVVKHAKCRRHIMSLVACETVPYVSTLSLRRRDFRGKVMNIKCVFWFSQHFLSETFLILRITERDVIKNSYWSPCKVSVILVRL